MTYRKDIDGLRALAVLPVVLFHAGFGFFSGGFVGVDVFFVISGYLITGIIFGEIAQEKFAILRFYERRIRRIFPALFAVLAFTLIAGLAIFLPEDLKALSGSIVAATLFVSNILFWRESGYFDTAAEMKPLLHTWSLAVEEQFYIFFPLFLMVAWRWGLFRRSARIVKWLTWAALLLSLAASIYGIRYHDEATFYLLPTRAWELLLGSVIALGAVPRVTRQWLREVLAALGIGLILYAVFVFDMTTPFPGEAALLPCLGAALIIYAGRDAAEPTWAARLLGMRPFVFIGLISYSLYLWHWPLIVFTKYYMIFQLNQMQEAMVVLAALIVATLSWRYIETPFRKGNDHYLTRNQARIFAVSGTAMSAAILIGLTSILFHGLPWRMDHDVTEIVATAKTPQKVLTQCLNNRKENGFQHPENSCIFASDNGQADTILWGDSHAGAILHGTLEALGKSRTGIRTLIMSGCPPLIGAHLSYDKSDNCYKYNLEAMRYIKTSTATNIILDARWAASLNGRLENINHGEAVPSISNAAGVRISYNKAKKLLAARLRETIKMILGTGKKVVLVYPVPESQFDIPIRLSQSLRFHGEDSLPKIVVNYNDFMQRSGDVIDIFDAIPNHENLFRVRPYKILCDDVVCLTNKHGKALYFDNNHLSIAGAELLSPLFAPVFNQSAN